jgi:cereblon
VDAQYLTARSDQQDPSLFAYWVAGNLPLSTAQRLDLLKMDSVVRLLRRELAILDTLEEDVLCARCGGFLATTREIFSMTVQGAAGTFVNPGGHVFQVLTLRDVHRNHVFIDPARSTEDSWFPGYAWSITHCGTCYNHLGWRFDCVEAELRPALFFGFRRAAITLSGSPNDRTDRTVDDSFSDAESLSSTPSSQTSPRSEEAPLLLTDVD